MSNAVGGSIKEVAVDGRVFGIAADTDAERSLGGYENEVEPNGDGMTGRLLQTVTAPEVGGLSLVIDDDQQDLEFLQARANAHEFFDFSYTEVTGITYRGTAQIVGGVKRSSAKATSSVAFKGVGVFSQV